MARRPMLAASQSVNLAQNAVRGSRAFPAVRASVDHIDGQSAVFKIKEQPLTPQFSTNTWRTLGMGLNGDALSIAVIGGDVYVGGSSANAGGVAQTTCIVHWDGSSWQPLGLGAELDHDGHYGGGARGLGRRDLQRVGRRSKSQAYRAVGPCLVTPPRVRAGQYGASDRGGGTGALRGRPLQ